MFAFRYLAVEGCSPLDVCQPAASRFSACRTRRMRQQPMRKRAPIGVLRCRFLETRAWHVTMIAMLMFVLFVPDIIALSDASNAVDPAINAALLLCMATFLSEFAANIACRPGYTPLEVWRGFVLLASLSHASISVQFSAGEPR